MRRDVAEHKASLEVVIMPAFDSAARSFGGYALSDIHQSTRE